MKKINLSAMKKVLKLKKPTKITIRVEQKDNEGWFKPFSEVVSTVLLVGSMMLAFDVYKTYKKL